MTGTTITSPTTTSKQERSRQIKDASQQPEISSRNTTTFTHGTNHHLYLYWGPYQDSNNTINIDARYSRSAKKKKTKKREEEMSYYHKEEEDGRLDLAHFTSTAISGSEQQEEERIQMNELSYQKSADYESSTV